MVEQCLQGRVDSEIRKTNGEIVPAGHAHIAASEGFKRISSQMDVVAGEYPTETTDAQGRRPHILSKFVMQDSEGNVFHVLQQASRISVGNTRAYCMWHQYAVCGDSIRHFLQFPTKWVTLRFQDKERDWRNFYLGALRELEAQVRFNLPPLSRLLERFGMSPKAFEVLLCTLFITLPDPTTYVVVLFDDHAMPDHEERIRQLLVYIYMMLPMAMRRAVGFETWLSGKMSAEQCELFFASSRFVTLRNGYSGIRLGGGSDASMLETSSSYLFFGNRLFHFPEEGLPGEKGSFVSFIHPWVERICEDKRCFQDLQNLNQLYCQIYDRTPLGRRVAEFVEELQKGALRLKSPEHREAVEAGFRALSDYRSLMDYQQILEGTKQISYNDLLTFTERFLADMGDEGNRALAVLFQKGLSREQISTSREGAKVLVEVLKRLEKDSPAHRVVMQLMSEYYRMKPVSMEEVDDFLLMAENGVLPLSDDAWQLALVSYVHATKAELPGQDAAFAWEAARHCLRLAIGRTGETGAEAVSEAVREHAKRAVLELMPRDFDWNADAEAAYALIGGIRGGDALLEAFVDRAELDANQVCDKLISSEGRAREFLWNKLDEKLPRQNLPLPLMRRLMTELPEEQRKLETVERALAALCRPLNLSEVQALLADGRAQGGEIYRRTAAHALEHSVAGLADTLSAAEHELGDARMHCEALLAYLNRQGAIADGRDFNALIWAAGRCGDAEISARLADLMDGYLSGHAVDRGALCALAEKLRHLPAQMQAGRLEILLNRYRSNVGWLDDCAAALRNALVNFPPEVVPQQALVGILEQGLRDGTEVRFETLENIGALRRWLRSEELRAEMARAIERCNLEQPADIRRLLAIGDSCDVRACARDRVARCLEERTWGTEVIFGAAQLFLDRGEADTAAELLQRAALAPEDANRIVAKLCREGMCQRPWPRECLEQLARRLDERVADARLTISELRELNDLAEQGKLPLPDALLERLMERMELGDGAIHRNLVQLNLLMGARKESLAKCAWAQAERIVRDCDVDIDAIQDWFVEVRDIRASQAQHLLQLLLSRLQPEGASVRQSTVLRILNMGQPEACDPEIVRLLGEENCVTNLKSFSGHMAKRSEQVQRAVIGSLDEAQLAGNISVLAYLDSFCIDRPELIDVATEKARTLFGGMRMDSALHAARHFRMAKLRSQARERVAVLLESGEFESARSDDERYEDFRDVAVWYASEPARRRTCCARLLDAIDGRGAKNGAQLIEKMHADLLQWEGDSAVCDALKGALRRCLDAEGTLLAVPEDPNRELEWYHAHSDDAHPLLDSWLRACLRGGLFRSDAFYGALVAPLNAMLKDVTHAEIARECFIGNIAPRMEKSLQQRTDYYVSFDAGRLAKFGSRIEDENLRRTILAESVVRVRDSQMLDKVLRGLYNGARTKTVPQEKIESVFDALLWCAALYAACGGANQVEARNSIVNYGVLALWQMGSVSGATTLSIMNIANSVRAVLLELACSPYWSTAETLAFMDAVLQRLVAEEIKQRVPELSERGILTLNDSIDKMGPYQNIYCHYLDGKVRKLAERCVRLTYCSEEQRARGVHEQRFRISQPQTIIQDCLQFAGEPEGWDPRVARSLVGGICEAYASLLKNQITANAIKQYEWPVVDVRSPLFDDAPNRECLIGFALVQLLNRLGDAPAEVRESLAEHYGRDEVEAAWDEALRRACLLGACWLRNQNQLLVERRALSQDAIERYERFCGLFVYAHSDLAISIASSFMMNTKERGLIDALMRYEGEDEHAEYVRAVKEQIRNKILSRNWLPRPQPDWLQSYLEL